MRISLLVLIFTLTCSFDSAEKGYRIENDKIIFIYPSGNADLAEILTIGRKTTRAGKCYSILLQGLIL